MSSPGPISTTSDALYTNRGGHCTVEQRSATALPGMLPVMATSKHAICTAACAMSLE